MKNIFLSFVVIFAISTFAFSQKRISPIKSQENKLNEEYCSALFKTADGVYFDFSDPKLSTSATAYRNILDWLQGRVAGLQVYKTRDDLSIPYLRNQRAAVYLDEMPVYLSDVNFFSTSDIAMIKVIKDPFVSGSRGPGGAIAIYTWRGEEE
jgi:hypothetical protein